MDLNEKYSFNVTWYDDVADLERPYVLSYFLSNNDIEMLDVKNRRPFLKRSPYPSLQLADLFVGNCVTVHSRQLKIVSYTNDFTARHFEAQSEKTLALIKPGMYDHIGQVMTEIARAGLKIIRLQMLVLSREDAMEFYAEHQGKPFFDNLVEMMISEPIVAMELMGPSAISAWRRLMGPTEKDRARMEAPNSIRAKFARNNTYNAVHGSDSPASAEREIAFFFGRPGYFPTTATFEKSSLVLIPRHSLPNLGEIISKILEEGFNVTAMEMFIVDKSDAADFYEIYRGVHQDYQGLVDELSSGPVVALEVTGENAQAELRELAGPSDPAIARTVAPDSLRGKYGKSVAKNAVHVTDLPTEAAAEVKFWFKLLRQ
ncbi:Nucleoside diphosphate kinase [Carpediemonas membranifera]|uniref:Nucleoside diphosphate kinase n=1 Tax=Carpediemonas membranifera TaxID=201153 RepID=A0A8J6AXQ1_9EUKA|nr:Nucleoside diphosphate kinase [Carpediemonas membranifera]|eukprot:KAG9394080.1 Nucleoside diphosphate kinase [Carpediemonas membranifera]